MREGYRGGFNKGQQMRQTLHVVLVMVKLGLQDKWAEWRGRKVIELDEPAHRYKSPINRQVFNDVKHSLKLVGVARGYESVGKVAKMHNVGRSTAYQIAAAPNYGHYKGTQTQVPVSSSSRAYKIPVQQR